MKWLHHCLLLSDFHAENGCFPYKKYPVYEFCDFALIPLDPRPINFADFNARGGGGPRGASL